MLLHRHLDTKKQPKEEPKEAKPKETKPKKKK